MQIRMKINVAGTFHNMDGGVVVGQLVDIDDVEAQRYIDLGYAELPHESRLLVEHAVASTLTQERAVVPAEIVVVPADAVVRSDEIAPNVTESEIVHGNPSRAVKRGPGRPRKGM